MRSPGAAARSASSPPSRRERTPRVGTRPVVVPLSELPSLPGLPQGSAPSLAAQIAGLAEAGEEPRTKVHLVDELLYAFVLAGPGGRFFLYIGSQRVAESRGGVGWTAYVDSVRDGTGGAKVVQARVRQGWRVVEVIRGTGEENAVTDWARSVLDSRWEVTGGLFAMRPTGRNAVALEVWQRQRLRLCTICGAAWHYAEHHGEVEPAEAEETAGEAPALVAELRAQLGARDRELADLRAENAQFRTQAVARDKELADLRAKVQAHDKQLEGLAHAHAEALDQAGEELRGASASIDQAREAQRLAEAAANAAAAPVRRFPTADEWLLFGPDALATEADLRETIEAAEARARRGTAGGNVRGKVLRILDRKSVV